MNINRGNECSAGDPRTIRSVWRIPLDRLGLEYRCELFGEEYISTRHWYWSLTAPGRKQRLVTSRHEEELSDTVATVVMSTRGVHHREKGY